MKQDNSRLRWLLKVVNLKLTNVFKDKKLLISINN